MFHKIVCVMICMSMMCLESTADRKPGDVVVFNNVTAHSVNLLGADDVKSEVNSEIGKKAIDFSSGASEKCHLISIEANESQAHLLSMKDGEFVNKKLIEVTDAQNAHIVTIKKGDRSLELVDHNDTYILGLYRHSSGRYMLIISEDSKAYREKERAALQMEPGMPRQWKRL